MVASTARAAPGAKPGRRFNEGTVCQARSGIIPLRMHPRESAELDTEVLFGECVTVLSQRNGWMHVRAELDGKEGFVQPQFFSDRLFTPTHRVRVPSVFTTRSRPVQSPFVAALGMNALVRVLTTPDKFSQLQEIGWVNHSCLIPIDQYEKDFVEVAWRFAGTPYFWGGRTGVRIDCSALVQTALVACGMASPRDSGPQSRELGVQICRENGLCRGDLVFWGGHVGIMVNRTDMLHATDNSMRVQIEPLQGVIERRRREEPEGKKEITVVRRLPEYAELLRCRL